MPKSPKLNPESNSKPNLKPSAGQKTKSNPNKAAAGVTSAAITNKTQLATRRATPPAVPPAASSAPAPQTSPASWSPAALSAGPALSFAQFQKLIYDRYFPTDSARGPAGTFLLLMEEIGELATALHENRPGKAPSPAQRENLAEEFADVIAWLTTLANIHGVDLAHALSKYTTPGRVEGVKD